MKTLFSILLALGFISGATAQNCDQYVYMTKGKTVKYSSANAKGKTVSTMQYAVTAKSGNKATVQSKVFDDKGKEISSADAEMFCQGNVLKIDMRNLMPSGAGSQFKDMTAKADVSFLTYPAKMQAGQQLEDGDFNMQMFNKDQKMADIAFKISDRKVEASESVTTPAGTFDCFKITYMAFMKTTTFGIGIPITMNMTEWYAPKLGLYVKSAAANKSGKPMSTTTLESIN